MREKEWYIHLDMENCDNQKSQFTLTETYFPKTTSSWWIQAVARMLVILTCTGETGDTLFTWDLQRLPLSKRVN